MNIQLYKPRQTFLPFIIALFSLFLSFGLVSCDSDDNNSSGVSQEVGYDISRLQMTHKSYDTSIRTSNARGIQLIGDTLLIVFARSTNAAESYILAEKSEINTASHWKSFSATPFIGSTYQGIHGHGIYLKPDDLSRMWILNRTEIWQFDLSVPGDISTSTQSGYYDFNNSIERGHSIYLSAAGDYLYIDDRAMEVIHQFELTELWDINAIGNSFAFSPNELHHGVREVVLHSNGTEMNTLDTREQLLRTYVLEEPWMVESAIFKDEISVDISNPRAFEWNSTGEKAYIMNTDTGVIYQYEIQ